MDPWVKPVVYVWNLELAPEILVLLHNAERPVPQVCQFLRQPRFDPGRVHPHGVTDIETAFQLLRQLCPA